MTVPSLTEWADGALDRLFRDEAPGLHRFFKKGLRDRDAAADLVQDTFVRMAAIPHASGIVNPGAYLQRIAQNLLRDRHRNDRRHPSSRLLALEDVDEPSMLPTQAVAIDHDQLLARYQQALVGLSRKTRTVFLLSRQDGLTYGEIRDRLGISMGTVEYHMRRAIAHIDEALGEP